MRCDSGVSILVLGLEPDVSAEVAVLARDTGFEAAAPREDESVLAAAFRLRPAVIMVQAGRPELDGDRIDRMAEALDAAFVIVGEDSLALRRAAVAHHAWRFALGASSREFESVVHEATGA